MNTLPHAAGIVVELESQKTRANKQAVKDLCNESRRLQTMLEALAKKMDERIKMAEDDNKDEVREKLKNSEDLNKRIERLQGYAIFCAAWIPCNDVSQTRKGVSVTCVCKQPL